MKIGRLGSRIGLAVVGLVLYLIFLIVFAPADYLVRGIAQLSGNTFILQQASGSLWHGSGTLVLPRTGPQPLGQMQWTIRPWRLLLGSLFIELQITGETEARGILDLGLQRHALRNLTATVPVRLAGAVYPPANLLGLSGRLRLTTTEIVLDKTELRGSAELLWEQATSRLLPIAETSDYKLQLVGQGKRADLRVSTEQGPLQVSGQGAWRLLEDGRLFVEGTVGLSTPQPALEPWLSAIGPMRPDGRRSFVYEIQLTLFQPATLFLF